MKKMIVSVLITVPLLALVTLTSIIGDQVSASDSASRLLQPEQAGFDDRISARAAGPGAPWINLSDGYEVPTVYQGSGFDQLAKEKLSPSALASGDYDEDGVPDLISAYAGSGGGLITLHFGNVDALYPNGPETQRRKANGNVNQSPFLPETDVFETEAAPDFLGAGDFDADGHWDVVAASRGGGAFYLLAGDGRGRFGPSRRIELPGRVTALVTGEINRADGLADIVVSISGANGPKALVFEGPEGAVSSEPESFSLPAEATALALGRLDGDYAVDLAVGAGTELLVVGGRDRKLSLDEDHQADVARAAVSRCFLPSGIVSIAVGDFQGDSKNDLAVLLNDGSLNLVSKAQATEKWETESVTSNHWPPATALVCARVSGLAKDDLLVSDRANRKLHILGDDAGTGKRGDTAMLSASQRRSVASSLDLDDEPIAVLADADELLSGFSGKLPYKLSASSPQGQMAVNLSNALDQYNSGALAGGPPSCD